MALTVALFRRIVLALALVAWITRLGAAQEARSGPDLGSLIAAGHAQRWDTLAIGERVGRFGRSMEGIPYVAGTLEGPGPEACRVTTEGLDCVTFMELALNLARTTRAADEREPAPEDVIDASFFITAGDKVPITVQRGDEKLTFEVEADFHPAAQRPPVIASPLSPQAMPLGLDRTP